MTEIAVREDTVSVIQAAAQDLAAAHKLATALCATSFAPPHFKGKPTEGAAAIMYGATINMDPLTSLQNIFIISGRPGLYARTMVALVLNQGHEVWTEVDTPEKVVVCGQRKGSSHVERSEWTIERAKIAGYLNNAKYKTDPQAMLYARAAGSVARKVAPDALLGMAYNVEELQLEQGDEPVSVTLERSGTARLAAALSPAEPELEPTAEPVVVEDPDESLWPEPAVPGSAA